ncbi:MAG: hydrogenase expression/formation protein HypE [Armatimonadetes bacterium]|nr:hydrogenase expression/formation protein HypE [Armatimonadota bacterium]
MSDRSEELITLGHGGGGRLMNELITGELLAASDVMTETDLEDAALIADGRLAMSTDSFTVQPLFFPGGDIGTLAVNGTVNDLAMRGARARWLSVGMIIEEGLPLDDLRRVVRSVRAACEADGVHVITGDTKVVGHGAADRLFINTTGVGEIFADPPPSARSARSGDVVLVNGTLGDHGITVLAAREELGLLQQLESDCASLLSLVETMWETAGAGVHCLRDATRGGLAAALNEIAATSQVAVEIEEAAVPVRPEVQGACELLGFSPLEIANEGKLVAIVAEEVADDVLAAMRAHPLGADAAIIGRVKDAPAGRVSARTSLGTARIVDLPAGELLPRIC